MKQTKEDLLGRAIVSGGGTIAFRTAEAVMKKFDKGLVSRTLARMTRGGALIRYRVQGTRESAWATTPSYAEQFAEKPGTRFMKDAANGFWTPGPEWRHDQLALLIAHTFADSEDVVVSEHELRRWAVKNQMRTADAALLHTDSQGKKFYCAVEVERSRKTGRKRGWITGVAPAIVDRMMGQGEHVEQLGEALGVTILVAPLSIATQIATRVEQVCRDRGLDWDDPAQDVWWLYVDADDPGGDARIWHEGAAAPQSGTVWPGLRAQQKARPRDAKRQRIRNVGLALSMLKKRLADITAQQEQVRKAG